MSNFWPVYARSIGWRWTEFDRLHQALDIVVRQQGQAVNAFFGKKTIAGLLPVEPQQFDARQNAQQALFLLPLNASIPFEQKLIEGVLDLDPTALQAIVLHRAIAARVWWTWCG